MTRKIIELGQLPGGVGGDTNRSANIKCNENFAELYGKMAEKGINSDITALSGLTVALSVAQGGTGAKNEADACRNIGALALGLYNDSYGTTLQNAAMPAIQYISNTSNRERGPLTLTNGGNDAASCVLTFHRVGRFACYLGIDTDNQLKIGGWSMGPVAHRIYHQGNTTITSDGTLKAI